MNTNKLALAFLLILSLGVSGCKLDSEGKTADKSNSKAEYSSKDVFEYTDYSKLPSYPALKVNLSSDTGAIRHGGIGFLYGLGKDGIPSLNLLAPLKPKVTAQKAPDGLQHPDGDALEVADTFFKAGGKQIQIYMQDIYSNWPYEFVGIQEYLEKLDVMINKVKASPYYGNFTYIPLNEPDGIWYNTASKKQAFFNDWKTIYNFIRSKDPVTKIAGPNVSGYNRVFMNDFMTFAKENNCLPDIITWHELNNSFYMNWYSNYEHYRNIESKLGIERREITINEYGNFMDLSNPGSLIQWLTRFEESKVDGAIAFWHAPNNLDDLAADTNKPTGAWWMYKWYSDMTGNTVGVTPPSKFLFGLQGIAALDKNKKQARVLFGGVDGGSNIIINDIPSGIFGDKVHATLWKTDWTGHMGHASDPMFISEGNYKVVDGKIAVTIEDMDKLAAYYIIITPNTFTESKFAESNWKATYEAEDAKLTNVKVVDGGSIIKSNLNISSNGKRVGYIDFRDSRVEFTVDAPQSGKYLLDIYYDNGTSDFSQHVLKVNDGKWRIIDYQSTAGWGFIDVKKVYVDLVKGENTITFGKYDASLGEGKGAVELDRIDITYMPDEGITEDTMIYEAEYANINNCKVKYSNKNYSGTGYVDGYLNSDNASTEFIVQVQSDGYYDVSLRYSAGKQKGAPKNRNVDLWVNGSLVKNINAPGTSNWNKWNNVTEKLFLTAGINRIDIRANSKNNSDYIAIDYLQLKPNVDNDALIRFYEAEDSKNTVSGSVKAAENKYASGGHFLAGIGSGTDNYLQINNIEVSQNGNYKMIVYYSNDERKEGHSYNIDYVDRYADISVNGGTPKRIYFRNTLSWYNFRSFVVDVELTSGSNTIKFSNSDHFAPDIDKVGIAPSYLP